MRTSRAITWSRLRVYLGALLLVLFARGALGLRIVPRRSSEWSRPFGSPHAGSSA